MMWRARAVAIALAGAALLSLVVADGAPAADGGLVVVEQPDAGLDENALRKMSQRELRRVLKERQLRCDGCDNKDDVIQVIL
jgi:hypothetical protein